MITAPLTRSCSSPSLGSGGAPFLDDAAWKSQTRKNRKYAGNVSRGRIERGRSRVRAASFGSWITNVPARRGSVLPSSIPFSLTGDAAPRSRSAVAGTVSDSLSNPVAASIVNNSKPIGGGAFCFGVQSPRKNISQRSSRDTVRETALQTRFNCATETPPRRARSEFSIATKSGRLRPGLTQIPGLSGPGFLFR